MVGLRILMCCSVVLSWATFPVESQTITPDTTVGTTVTLNGNTYAITDGTKAGANLFHSFERFGLNSGTVADFQDTVGGGIENVVSRVTGGNESLIDGQIRSSIASANFFFINPSGITFTENASLDVTGSFLASTADFIGFGPGEAVFSASDPVGGALSAAPPQAFGFLGNGPASVNVIGPTLDVPSGKTLSLIGGDFTVEAANVLAPGGRIDVVSVASSGEVEIPTDSEDGPNLKSFGPLGVVDLSDGATLNAGGDGGGTMFIRSGRLVADGAFVFASTVADAPSGMTGAGIDAEVAGDVILKNGTQVGTNVFGGVSQDSGGVRIRAESVDIVGGSVVESNAFFGSTGSGGAIEIAAGNVSVRDGAVIRAITSSAGDSGDTFVSADSFEVRNGSFVFSIAQGTGNAGDIEIDAGSVAVSTTFPFTAITSQTFGPGAAGVVRVETSDLDVGFGTEISSVTFGPGPGNDVSVVARDGALDLLVSGGGLFANSFGAGSGGNLEIGSVDAPGTAVRIENRGSLQARGLSTGHSGKLSIHADLVEVVDGGLLNTSTFGFFGFGPARAGDIEITADRVVMSGFKRAADPILSDATGITTVATNGSGDIRITAADTLTLTNRARFNASTFGAGPGGTMVLDVGRLELLQGGNILSNAFSSGNGGAIDVTADEVVISGVHPEVFTDPFSGLELLAVSAIGVQSQSRGAAGEIRIDTGTLKVRDGGRISSETFAAGDGGAIRITADSTLVAGVSRVQEAFQLKQGVDPTQAIRNASAAIIANTVPLLNETTGPGGVIEINSGTLKLRDGGLILSSTRGNALGGSVQISSEDVILAGKVEIGADTRSTGNAGNITLDVRRLTLRDGALINVNTTDEGTGGNIIIRARDLVTLTGSSPDGRASAVSTESESKQPNSGPAGSIDITSRSLLIQDGGKVSGNTSGGGQGGDIRIAAIDEIIIAGTSISSGEGSAISTESTSSAPGAGPGGNIRIAAADLTVRDGGAISTRSAVSDGGDVMLDVDSIVFLDGGRITTSVSKGAARGGSVNITAGQVDLLNDALISARNLGGGDAGNVSVTADSTVHIDASTVTTSAEQGASGNVEITAGTDVEIMNGALVTAETFGPGDTGDILIVAVNNLSVDKSTVSTQAVLADGGNLKLGAGELVLLTDSTISSSVGTGEGAGGNISIDPVFVILRNSRIQANAFGGPGGNILIATNFFIADPSSVVEASSVKDIAGNVVITAPDTDVTGALVVLPSEYVDAASRLAADCSARGSQAPASLVGEGRGGLPVPPGGPRISYYAPPSAAAVSPGAATIGTATAQRVAKALVNSSEGQKMLVFIPVTLAGDCEG